MLDGSVWCDRCDRAHQPRERPVPCSWCNTATANVHAVCDKCESLRGSIISTGAGYFVKSRSSEGAYRLVNGDECSCPSFAIQCWHKMQVAALVRMDNVRHRRYQAPVNVSALVD